MADNASPLAAGTCGKVETVGARRPLSGACVLRGHADFGKLDADPQLDLGEHGVEVRLAGAVGECRHDRLERGERAGLEGTGKEPELEGVEGVERGAAALNGAPTPLERI